MLREYRKLTGSETVPRSSSRCFGHSSSAPINACSTSVRDGLGLAERREVQEWDLDLQEGDDRDEVVNVRPHRFKRATGMTERLCGAR